MSLSTKVLQKFHKSLDRGVLEGWGLFLGVTIIGEGIMQMIG